MMNHYNKFLLFAGSFLISLIIYNRLIRIRLPKEFAQISFIFTFCISSFMFVLLLLAVIKFYKYLTKHNKTTFIFLQKIYEHKYNPIKIAQNSMIEFDRFIKNKIPYYNEHERYTDFLLKSSANYLLNNKYKIIFIIGLFSIMPQIIVCYSFIFDLLFKGKFIYFYKNMWLLLLPLLLNYYIYSVKTFIETNIEGLNDVLVLKIIPTNKLISQPNEIDYLVVTTQEWQKILLTPEGNHYTCYNNLSDEMLKSFDGDLLSAEATLHFCLDFLNVLFHLDYCIKNYNDYKIIIEIPLNIMKYFIFFTGWGYILYIIHTNNIIS